MPSRHARQLYRPAAANTDSNNTKTNTVLFCGLGTSRKSLATTLAAVRRLITPTGNLVQPMPLLQCAARADETMRRLATSVRSLPDGPGPFRVLMLELRCSPCCPQAATSTALLKRCCCHEEDCASVVVTHGGAAVLRQAPLPPHLPSSIHPSCPKHRCSRRAMVSTRGPRHPAPPLTTLPPSWARCLWR